MSCCVSALGLGVAVGLLTRSSHPFDDRPLSGIETDPPINGAFQGGADRADNLQTGQVPREINSYVSCTGSSIWPSSFLHQLGFVLTEATHCMPVII